MEYLVDRKVWQVLWAYTLGNKGFGYHDKPFENEVFQIKPYCYNEEHDNSYHFYHKPSGFKIQWYKYALRDATCNMNINSNQFIDIMYDCLNSLEKDKRVRIIHDTDKWWL